MARITTVAGPGRSWNANPRPGWSANPHLLTLPRFNLPPLSPCIFRCPATCVFEGGALNCSHEKQKLETRASGRGPAFSPPPSSAPVGRAYSRAALVRSEHAPSIFLPPIPLSWPWAPLPDPRPGYNLKPDNPSPASSLSLTCYALRSDPHPTPTSPTGASAAASGLDRKATPLPVKPSHLLAAHRT